MIAKVFHAKESDFFYPATAFVPDAFDHVADVVVPEVPPMEQLEAAYELTNNLDKSWTLNKGVKAHQGRTRSTSVGDIIQLGDKFFAVSGMSFLML